jgi:hypothetical protein
MTGVIASSHGCKSGIRRPHFCLLSSQISSPSSQKMAMSAWKEMAIVLDQIEVHGKGVSGYRKDGR